MNTTKQPNKKIVALVSIVVMLLGVAALLFLRPANPDITTPANNLTALPEAGRATSMTIDFKTCNPGRDGIAFGFGSEQYTFTDNQSENCIVKYSREIEMGQGPVSVCSIPKSLGVQTFRVGDQGTSFSAQMREYCNN